MKELIDKNLRELHKQKQSANEYVFAKNIVEKFKNDEVVIKSKFYNQLLKIVNNEQDTH